jgi:TraM recognition site of TraD and TraG
MLFMLDECANIAPIPDLPAMLSEAGGQGLQTVVVLQDLSQARRHWKADADGLLTLFGAKAILSGIADTTTLKTTLAALRRIRPAHPNHHHPSTHQHPSDPRGRTALPKAGPPEKNAAYPPTKSPKSPKAKPSLSPAPTGN